MMRADEPTEAVEDGAVDVPIRSPIGSLRRAEVAACVLAAGAARPGAISISPGRSRRLRIWRQRNGRQRGAGDWRRRRRIGKERCRVNTRL